MSSHGVAFFSPAIRNNTIAPLVIPSPSSQPPPPPPPSLSERISNGPERFFPLPFRFVFEHLPKCYCYTSRRPSFFPHCLILSPPPHVTALRRRYYFSIKIPTMIYILFLFVFFSPSIFILFYLFFFFFFGFSGKQCSTIS